MGIRGQRLANMSPPSLLLAGDAITCARWPFGRAPAIAGWAQKPRVWWLTVIGNSGPMTLYLWHIPALLGVHLMFDSLGWFRYPGQPHLILLSIVQFVVMAGLVAALFVTLRPLENSPLPGWDGAAVLRPGSRSVAVEVLLCVTGAATLAAARWGLRDDGLYCVAIMLAGLVGARMLAIPGRIAASGSVVQASPAGV